MPNAIAVLAAADRGAMFDPSAVFYMDKLVTGPEAADFVDINAPVSVNIRRVARPRTARPRTSPWSSWTARATRARQGDPGDRRAHQVHLRRRRRRRDHGRREGTGVDLLLGIGGTPEGIIAACAIKCLGGVIQGKLWPKDEAERQRALDAGHDLDRMLSTDDLVSGDNVFFVATGITDGELVRGVRYPAATRPRSHW